MQKSKDELQKQSNDFEALKRLTESSGWKIVKDILKNEFNEALDIVSDPKTLKAEIEARGIIKFIKKFTDTINSEMGFGKQAKEEYVKKFVNPPKDE